MDPPEVPAEDATAAWNDHLTPTERAVYERAGYWRSFGLGTRPALLVIDVEYNFTGDVDEPILDSIRKYPNSCGPAAWAAIPVIATLIRCARLSSVPVVFTHGRDESEPPPRPRRGNQVVDELTPIEDELVVEKPAASAFFDTPTAAYLAERHVDTVVHIGCTTSGCVRASVVDAAALGFKNAVVADAVFDRARHPHLASLFDLHAKYADVVSSTRTEHYLRSTASARAG